MQLRHEDGSTIWLAYAMNVHAGGDAATFESAIDEVVAPLRTQLGVSGPFGLATRFDAAGIRALATDTALRERMGAQLSEADLVPFSGNAFVLGRFHGAPLKDAVYAPPWGHPDRTSYTLMYAAVLAAWRAPDAVLSLSTAPGSWRGWRESADAAGLRAGALVTCAAGLQALEARTGVRVRLGLEPEPRCSIETIDELVAFFEGPLARALESAPELRTWLGVCYDACHQAVMHEPAEEALARLAAAGIDIVKFQASSALEVAEPDAAARAALAAFDEPIYLHQVAAPDDAGRVHVAQDLSAVLGDKSGLWMQRRPWRIHYHVPIFRAAAVPPLGTTQGELRVGLRAALEARQVQHVEIETYTFDVLPAAERDAGSGRDLVAALVREYETALEIAAGAGFRP
jgi:hypothetical protein